MPLLEIKTSHKPIKQYYAALEEFEKQGVTKETSVRAAFQEVLTTYARKMKWSFTAEHPVALTNKNKGSVDGVVMDEFTVLMGYWEAKDSDDDFKKEIKHKFEIGYPKNNILFQSPLRAVLYQDGGLVNDYDISKPENLVSCLTDFFGYKANDQAEWSDIVDQFKERIPENAKQLIAMIEEEKKTNKRFQSAFQTFAELCRASINPNLADAAIEEMLVQHILTARIFETVFDNPEFVRRNVIAAEIERVVDALTSQKFNRKDFYKPLDHFYVALENRAKSITNWSEKQSFLNTVYEKFFQGFAVKVADTHGIVYTPQPIVDFMVRSVQHILKTEFNRSLADEGVHILDPFVGTGNFIMRIMKEIAATQKTKLPKKYASELHCNEVMLLPYYIASMNIEHEYYTQTGDYKPFDGICLVDTFELREGQGQIKSMSDENSKRIERQKEAPIFVVMGNPPYNAWQQNENDNNKNRRYPNGIDRDVADTYARLSKAQNKNALSDPYVKAFRFAYGKVHDQGGIIAFVSTNSYLTDIAFDGMRKHLHKNFDEIFVLDLGGNVRKNPKLSGTTHNVFGIQVGVSIALLVRKRALRMQASPVEDTKAHSPANIFYARLPEDAKKQEKLLFLKTSGSIEGVNWASVKPDESQNWLSTGMEAGFGAFIELGVDSTKKAIFSVYSRGLETARDAWVYNFSANSVAANVSRTLDIYNEHVERYRRLVIKPDVDSFVSNNPKEISWSSRLKERLARGTTDEFQDGNIRPALYRPFTKQSVYYDHILIHRPGHFGEIFPMRDSENVVICVSDKGNRTPFSLIAAKQIPDLHLCSASDLFQCFPFYTYSEDGSHRTENITDWALGEFRQTLASVPGSAASRSSDKKGRGSSASAHTERVISKWDIFYYVYGLLHHPEYRTKYAANLRRELPRIPISPDFWAISEAGKKLADLHVNYESAKEYPLVEEWKENTALDLHVEKMKLTKDKTGIVYNDKLTLRGIPPEAFEYRLGNRSAIDWIIDQYQVSTDKRSGITNDPNRADDEMYIVSLIRKVVTVSMETVRIVGEIEKLSLG